MMRLSLVALLIVLGTTILVLSISFCMHVSQVVYGVNTYIDSTILGLWSEDELFVFIGHGTSIIKGNRAKLPFERLTYTPQFPEQDRKDLLVAHVKGDTISVFDLKGFGYSGSPFVYNGSVYWARGQAHGDRGPCRWKWADSVFTALSAAETKELNQQIGDFDATTRAEGWSQISMKFGGNTPEFPFHLRSGDIVVLGESIAQPDGSERNRITLLRRVRPEVRKVVIEVLVGYREATKKDYLRLRSDLLQAPK